jgi:maltooligosyltrehalose trehalohydrolase
MLFMGEEWGCKQPFLFFCDFADELAAKVRQGRREEFSHFPEFSDPEARERIPDPGDIATYRKSKLDWQAIEDGEHAEWLAFYRQLLAIRRNEIVPRLAGIKGHAGGYEVLGLQAVKVNWALDAAQSLTLIANLKDEPFHCRAPEGRCLWLEGALADGRLSAWGVIWTIR